MGRLATEKNVEALLRARLVSPRGCRLIVGDGPRSSRTASANPASGGAEADLNTRIA